VKVIKLFGDVLIILRREMKTFNPEDDELICNWVEHEVKEERERILKIIDEWANDIDYNNPLVYPSDIRALKEKLKQLEGKSLMEKK
jgi:hypothetical protein